MGFVCKAKKMKMRFEGSSVWTWQLERDEARKTCRRCRVSASWTRALEFNNTSTPWPCRRRSKFWGSLKFKHPSFLLFPIRCEYSALQKISAARLLGCGLMDMNLVERVAFGEPYLLCYIVTYTYRHFVIYVLVFGNGRRATLTVLMDLWNFGLCNVGAALMLWTRGVFNWKIVSTSISAYSVL